jgi:predicted ATP-grasp superfamily ATP-dependent carboligase
MAMSVDKLLESAKKFEEGLKQVASEIVKEKSKLDQELKTKMEQMARR